MAYYVRLVMRAFFRLGRERLLSPTGERQLGAVADRWMTLNGSYKVALRRWQIYCWEQLCNDCAAQHDARKTLLPVLGAWKAYIRLMSDLFRRQMAAAGSMSAAVRLHPILLTT